MTTMGLDDTDMEFDEGDSDELWDDSDGEDQDAEGRSSRDRRRRAVQQRIARARGRRELARARGGALRPTAPGRATPQQAVTAIRNLDLDTKVQEDTFRRAITTQSKRMNRSDYAAVASVAINQAIESFDAPDNPYGRSAARFAPLLLLSPQNKRPGFEGFVLDPRVMGGVALLAITVLGENRKRFTLAREISVSSPSELAVGDSDQLMGDVLDARGKVLKVPVSWVSSNPDLAKVGSSDGLVEAVKAGNVIITAAADGVVRRVRLKITPAAAGGGGGGGGVAGAPPVPEPGAAVVAEPDGAAAVAEPDGAPPVPEPGAAAVAEPDGAAAVAEPEGAPVKKGPRGGGTRTGKSG